MDFAALFLFVELGFERVKALGSLFPTKTPHLAPANVVNDVPISMSIVSSNASGWLVH